ncbi:hypothetical protein FisN_6Hh191 [Fistulifera solaris]|uniref:Uncharacterized protein n=1 Tax=Fistulifera solaris TaxID=1519565 RepID=A0A1Z5KEW4_FISSO|nr:hypothetical protein FisN_6Hh191 [Fistulifera solaris]|eukprot:GAX24860.1 hypothetical protein FisN_6Hh191 [Fistulifera solaris]
MTFCGGAERSASPVAYTAKEYGAQPDNTQAESKLPSKKSMESGDAFERENSAFGDGYSLHSRPSQSTSHRHLDDEIEVDYDHGATDLYRRIENKDWDGALNRLEFAPHEARAWVARREPSSMRLRWRLLPIHAVCIFRAPLALIEALIEVYPDGPMQKDDQGMLPVHLACRNGASKGVVLTLLEAFPESLKVKDRKNRTAVDLVATSESANKEAVLVAIRRFQKETQYNGAATVATIETAPTVQEVDYEHRTTLFRMILRKDWNNASSRAVSHPEEACTWIVTKGFNGNLRFLPLHKACVLQPPDSIVTGLLKAFPEGAKNTDQDGWLPLHCACFYGASEHVVNALLFAYSKGAQTKDDEGRLPLHYACIKGAPKAVIDVLLASFSRGAMVKDDEGRLALHHACSKNAEDSVIEALLKSSPKAAQTKDDQGRLALHHACRKCTSDKTIRTLLRVYPIAAQIRDDQDKLPLHYACQHGGKKEIIQLLLQSYPESVNVPNGVGQTPLAEIKAMNNPKFESIVRLMEKIKKEQDKKRGIEGPSPVLESTVRDLNEKIQNLEKSLGKVTLLGKEMKEDLRKGKDPVVVMEKFSDALIDLGSRSKTPLKSRQQPAPPAKGIFGRVKQKA